MRLMLKKNHYDLDHTAVNKKFDGDLTYIGDILLGDSKTITAVYKANKPNYSKGHKEYMGLLSKYDPVLFTRQWYVVGITQEELDKGRKADGILCKECNTALLSLSIHDFVECGCPNSAFVDGGQFYYVRRGAVDMSKLESITVDMLTGEIVDV